MREYPEGILRAKDAETEALRAWALGIAARQSRRRRCARTPAGRDSLRDVARSAALRCGTTSIDGSFVREILRDPIEREMARSINEIGHLTGKQTIAEFAENAEIIQMLTSLGVDYA